MGLSSWLILMALVAACSGDPDLPSADAAPRAECRIEGGDVDGRQAEAVVALLEEMAGGGRPEGRIDRIMALPGTDLVVSQMNLARRVSAAQYRSLLQAFVRGEEPRIAPVDTTMRAARGVEGLVRDAARNLAWGLDHVEAVRAGLDRLTTAPLGPPACAIAQEFLPHAVELRPTLSLVAGGRAGAAALPGDHLYADVVVMTRLAVDGGAETLNPDAVQRFFAHEVHHLALQRILRAAEAAAALDESESLTIRVMEGLILEGSATYFIDWRSDAERGRQEPRFRDLMAEPTTLLAEVEGILSDLVTRHVTERDEFEALTSEMFGNRYHAAGAILVGSLDRAFGRWRALEALRDPRALLATYNEAIEELEDGTAYRFDEELSRALLAMGG